MNIIFDKAVRKLSSLEKGHPFVFLLMTGLMNVTGAGFNELLSSKFSPLSLTLGGVGLIIILFLLYFYVWKPLQNVFKNGFFSTRSIEKKQYKGMIVFASAGTNPSAINAITEHIDNLEKCWVITGDEDTVTGSLANALSLKDVFKEELEKKPDGGKDFFEIKKLTVDKAYNPSAVYDMVENIFSNLPEGIKETDVISDYTGGTKSMSAGMILACALPSRDLQVLKPKILNSDGTADRQGGQYPLFIDIQFKVKKRSR